MVLDWKNQYGQGDSTSLANIQIQCNLLKLPMSFFKELEFFFKFDWKHKIDRAILGIGGNGTGGIRLPDFRLYYKAIDIKTV